MLLIDTHAHTHVHMHMHMYTHTHTCTRAHVHTHAHTRLPILLQAAPPDIPAGQSTPGTPLPSAGGTPLSQSIQAVTPPISALPPHLVAQASHPGSPFSESPAHTPSINTPTGVHLVHPILPGPYTPQVLRIRHAI